MICGYGKYIVFLCQKSKQIPTFNIMYRVSIRFSKSKKENLDQLSSNRSQLGTLLVPCGDLQRSYRECSKQKPLPESRITGAQCRNSQVLRSLVLFCSCQSVAIAESQTHQFASSVYEGQSKRFYRVHPLEQASRKKYYRTHRYSNQTILVQ